MNLPVNLSKPGMTYDLLTGLVAPRPIALVTTLNDDGQVDAAPYSAYNYLCSNPPILALGIMNKPDEGAVLKQTAINIRQTGKFVVNVVTEDISEQMNICSMEFPEGQHKVEAAGLETSPSSEVKVPRLKQAHAALECVLHRTLGIGEGTIVLGRVVSIYVEDRFVDPAGPYVLAEDLHAIGRMNGLGMYVKTQGAFHRIPRIQHAEWAKGQSKTPGIVR